MLVNKKVNESWRIERSLIMFGKAVVGGMIVVALMSITPGLAGLAFIIIPIVIVILQNKEERAANEAKYGWDPVRDKFDDLPKEQKDRVRQALINVFNECEAHKGKAADDITAKQINKHSTSNVSSSHINAVPCSVNLVPNRDEWDDDW